MPHPDGYAYRPLPEKSPALRGRTYNPTNPSIPSKFEYKQVEHVGEKNGFGNRSSRFNNYLNDIPGPGYYSSSAPGLTKEGPSISKKGYGNAFLSKRSRLESVVVNTNIAGPGYYNPKPVPDIYRTSRGAFPESTAERMPYEDVKKKVKPGPGDYHIDKNPGLPKYLQQKPSSSFVSTSTRESTMSNKFVPGPASYCPNTQQPQQQIIWSRSKHARFQDLGVDNKVPGPGHYFDENMKIELEEKARNNNRRSVGRHPGKYLGKHAEKRSNTVPTFGADASRFKHSFLGQLEHAAESPGPGWYAPLHIIPPQSVAAARRAASPPLSPRTKEASRCQLLKPLEHRTPGPAYYNPKPINTRIKPINADMKWL